MQRKTRAKTAFAEGFQPTIAKSICDGPSGGHLSPSGIVSFHSENGKRYFEGNGILKSERLPSFGQFLGKVHTTPRGRCYDDALELFPNSHSRAELIARIDQLFPQAKTRHWITSVGYLYHIRGGRCSPRGLADV
jgi:hypothetical protein